jgi:hypothetical protein
MGMGMTATKWGGMGRTSTKWVGQKVVNMASNSTSQVMAILARETQIGNVKNWYVVRMRHTAPRIVIELKNLPADLQPKAERAGRAKAAARDMVQRRTLRYRDLERLGHGRRAIRDGIAALEREGYIQRARGRTAVWLK